MRRIALMAGVAIVSVAAGVVSCGEGARPTPKPHDDLSLFISKYGPPDSEISSEDEVPRPPFVSRQLIYERENLRVVYLADAPMGSPPPYEKWKLMGFQNHKTDEVIEPAEAVRLLKGRERKR